jgi:hypothetical protein
VHVVTAGNIPLHHYFFKEDIRHVVTAGVPRTNHTHKDPYIYLSYHIVQAAQVGGGAANGAEHGGEIGEVRAAALVAEVGMDAIQNAISQKELFS